MDQQYIPRLTEAYRRGYEKKYAGAKDAPEMKLHYFKVKDDLPRVQVVLSFLQGAVAAEQCRTLLDIGSGRGVFLFPPPYSGTSRILRLRASTYFHIVWHCTSASAKAE